MGPMPWAKSKEEICGHSTHHNARLKAGYRGGNVLQQDFDTQRFRSGTRHDQCDSDTVSQLRSVAARSLCRCPLREGGFGLR